MGTPAWQHHEARQQELLEGIMRDVQAALEEQHENYGPLMAVLGADVILMTYGQARPQRNHNIIGEMLLKVAQFTFDESEQRYLMGRLAEECQVTAAASRGGAYQARLAAILREKYGAQSVTDEV